MANYDDEEALDDIQALLNGKQWNPDTIEHIAAIVRATGRQVKDVE